MDLEQQLRWALAPGEPRMEAEDALMQRVSAAAWRSSLVASRKPRRLIVLGVALVAAAAALLALRPGSQPPPAAVMPIPVPAQQAVEEGAEVAAPITPTPLEPASAPDATPSTPLPVAPAATAFTVSLTLQDKTTDEASKAGLAELHANILERLRRVPGLSLIERGTSDSAAGAQIDYDLVVGGSAGSGNRGFSASLTASVTGPDGALKFRSGMVTTVIPGRVRPDCMQPDTSPVGCRDPDSVAASMVDSMRKRVFPPDPSMRKALQTDLLDQGLDPRQRLQALGTITMLNREPSTTAPGGPRVGGRPLDAAVIRGATDVAAKARDATVRAQVWRTLRESRSAGLLQPLIVASRQEPDGEARLEAVATLVGFNDNDAARAALATVASEDSLPLVRAVAQRGLAKDADATWNTYMLDSLKDPSRSAAQRIEALVHGTFDRSLPNTVGNQWGRARGLLDDEAIRALAQVLPELQPSAQMTPPMLGQLMTNVSSIRHPAITDLLLQALAGRAGRVDGTTAAWALLDSVEDPRVPAALAASQDPGVRRMLEQASTSDADPARRELATRVLNAVATSSTE